MRTISSVLALALALASCAQPGDEPAFELLRVVVVDSGERVANAPVVFHDASGAIIAVVRTDQSGAAEHPLPPGGSFTIAHPPDIADDSGPLTLVTYTGVEPGFEIAVEIPELDPDAPMDPGPIAASVEISLPPLPGPGYAEIHLGCIDVSTDQPVVAVDVPRACLGTDNLVDITAEAFITGAPENAGMTFARDVQVRGDQTAQVTLPAWITEPPLIAIHVDSFPAWASDFFATPIMLADGLEFAPIGVAHARVEGGPVELQAPFYVTFSADMDLELELVDTAGNRSVNTGLAVPAPPDPVSADSFLAPFAALEIDPTVTALSWARSTPDDRGNAIVAHVHARRGSRAIRWVALAPPGTESPLPLPELPPELAGYRPAPGDDSIEPGIVQFDANWIGDYQQFILDHGVAFLDDPCVPFYSNARAAHAGRFAGPVLRSALY